MKKLLLLLMAVVSVCTVKATDYTISFIHDGTEDGSSVTTATIVNTLVTDNSKIYVGDDSKKLTTATRASGKSKLGLKLGNSGNAGIIGFDLENLDSYNVSAIKLSAAYYNNDKDAKMGIKIYINSQEVGSLTNFGKETLVEQTLTLSAPVSPESIKLETYSTAGNVSSTNQARAYISSVTFVTEDGDNTNQLGNISLSLDGKKVLQGSYQEVYAGVATFLIHADNATSFSTKINGEEKVSMSSQDGDSEWTPMVAMAYTPVTIVAHRDGCDDKEFSFNLKVNEFDSSLILGNVSGIYNGTSINEDDDLTVVDGTTFYFTAENATAVYIKDLDSKNGVTDELDLVDGQFAWTPVTFDKTHFEVSAVRPGQDSKTLSFYLTVTEKPLEPGDIYKEVITSNCFSHTQTSYAQDSYTSSKTDIAYSIVFSCGGTATAHTIAFNAGNKNGGKSSELIVTSNDKKYILKKIEIDFASNSSNGIDVYAQSANYSAVTTVGDVPDKTGDKLGTIGTGTNMVASIELDENANYTAVALFPASTSSTSMNSITLTWEVAAVTPSVEKPGDVVMTYTDEHGEFIDFGNEEIKIEEGVKFTFTATGATHIEVRHVLDDPVVLVEADGESVTWTPTEDCIFDVVATNEGGSSEYDMTTLLVLTFEHQSDDLKPTNEIDSVNHIVKFSCTKGKLMIKKSVYVEEEEVQAETEALMAVRTDEDWYAANQNAKLHHEDLSQYEEGDKFVLTAKAVSLDGTKESPEVSVKVNIADIISGIWDVNADSVNAEVEYHNLQGVRVEATTPGIYLVRRGNEVSKVVIR